MGLHQYCWANMLHTWVKKWEQFKKNESSSCSCHGERHLKKWSCKKKKWSCNHTSSERSMVGRRMRLLKKMIKSWGWLYNVGSIWAEYLSIKWHLLGEEDESVRQANENNRNKGMDVWKHKTYSRDTEQVWLCRD